MRLSRSWLKLRRDIFASGWQFLAVAVVIALGVAIFIGTYGSYQNLRSSYDRTYEELDMGDLWFEFASAPADVGETVEGIEGVAAAEARLVRELPMEVPDTDEERVLGRFVALPSDRRPSVNDVKVTEGAYFSAASGQPEALLEKSFADYHDLGPGDRLQALTADGGATEFTEFTVAGVAASPEYLWVSKSEQELFTLPSTFGVVFVPGEQLAALTGDPEVNEVVVRLENGADASAVRTEIESSLAPFGVQRVTDREHQLSNRLLQLDLDGFQTLAVVFPVLFLSVSVLVVYTLMNRLVQTQRPHIGLMRAIGYSRRQVLVHYLVYGLAIGVAAALGGLLLGFVLSILVTEAYGYFLNVPFISQKLYPETLAIGVAAGILASVIAAGVPAWSGAGIRPAEAMHPPPPATGRRTILEIIVPPLRRVSYLFRLPLRNLFRAPRRTVYTALGVGSGVALVLVAVSFLDSYDRMINLQFDDIQKYDAIVEFSEPVPAAVSDEAGGFEGVARSEALVDLPVRLSVGDESHTTLLRGIEPGSTLYGTLTPDGRPVSTGEGVLLTSAIAGILGVGPGDSVSVQPQLPGAPAQELPVDDVVQQPVGDVAFTGLARAQGLVGGQEIASGLLVELEGEPDEGVKSRLLALPGTPTVEYTEDVRELIDELNELFFVFVGIMLAFGVALGFAVIFNTITINTLERQRELATMRTIGSGVARLGGLLTMENVLMGLLGLVVGLPVGYGISLYFGSLYQNDLFDMQTVIYTRSYGIAALGAIIVLLLAELPSIRFVRKLDLPAVVREMSN